MTLATRPKPSAPYRKRSGQHHNQGKHYLKAYWPYLPLLGIVTAGLLFNNVLSHKQDVLGYATDMSAQVLLQDTNTQRTTYQESTLTLNPTLEQAAQNKANNMATLDYWSHDTPSGQTPWSFMTAVGYNYQRAGENLAYGFDSAGQTVTAWMNSPDHRANILDSNYSQIGFGIVDIPNYQNSGPETLVVAFYAEPSTIETASAPITNQTGTLENISSSAIQPSSQSVARIQLLTGGSTPWALFVVSMATCIVAAIFVIRHGLLWRRVLVKSEAFVIKHPLFDFAVVGLGMIGIILSQSTGFIR